MLTGFNIFAVALTLAGGLAAVRFGSINRRILYGMLAAGSGIMTSVVFLDLFPEAWSAGSSAGLGACAAVLFIFMVENFALMHSCPECIEDCHAHAHTVGMAALAAISLHSLLDGFNMAVAFESGSRAGISTGMAIAIHKFADGLTLSALLIKTGYSRQKSLILCFLLALATPLGSAVSAPWLGDISPDLMSALIGFAGGSLLYIAMADILPQLHKAGDKTCAIFFPAGFMVTFLLHSFGG